MMTEEKNNIEDDKLYQHDAAEAPVKALEKQIATEEEQFSAQEIDEKLEQAQSASIDYQLAQARRSNGLEHISVIDLAIEEVPIEEDDADCLNCSAPLKGTYCHNCGQPDRHFIRFFPKVLWEMINEAFDFDSKVFRTLKSLLFSPARLSMEYVSGRRARYVNPLRLYIILSVLFFIALTFIADDNIQFENKDANNKNSGVYITQKEDVAAAENISPDKNTNPEDEIHELDITLDNGENWDVETNPLTFNNMFSAETTKEINLYLWNLVKKFELAINNDPNVLLDEFFNVIPQLMFVLLPLFALLLKVTYIFNKRYYMEHLILALHSHSFIFFALLLIILMNALSGSITQPTWLVKSLGYAMVILGIWIPLNLYISQKRMYAQGYFLSTIKFIFVAAVYWMLLICTSILAFVVGLVNL